MKRVTVRQIAPEGITLWKVEAEEFPPLAPFYARLDTALGLLQARARDFEKTFEVTVVQPGAAPQTLTFDGKTMQKLPPTEWKNAA